MREFLISCEGGWGLPYARWPDVFHPTSFPFERVPGAAYRILVAGVPIYFGDEPPGIQMCVEGDLPEVTAGRVAAEVLANLERVAGKHGDVIDFGDAEAAEPDVAPDRPRRTGYGGDSPLDGGGG